MRRDRDPRWSPAPVDEARADDDVRLVPVEHGEQLRKLGRVVLPVAVEPDRELVAVLERELEAGLHGRADAEVERQPDDERARSARPPPPCGRWSRRRSRRRPDPGRRRGSRRRRRRPPPPRSGPGRSRCGGRGSPHAHRRRRARAAPAPAARDARTCARRARARGPARPSPRPAPDRRAARDRPPSACSASSTTSSSLPGLEPALDPRVRVGDDRRARRGELERPAGRRAGTVACERRVMLRLTRAAEIARAKTLNGTSPSSRALPDVALEVAPAEREVDLGRRPARLADHRLLHSRRNLSP